MFSWDEFLRLNYCCVANASVIKLYTHSTVTANGKQLVHVARIKIVGDTITKCLDVPAINSIVFTNVKHADTIAIINNILVRLNNKYNCNYYNYNQHSLSYYWVFRVVIQH